MYLTTLSKITFENYYIESGTQVQMITHQPTQGKAPLGSLITVYAVDMHLMFQVGKKGDGSLSSDWTYFE